MTDNVNSPKHYQLLPGVEVIDVRDAIMDKIDKMPKRLTAKQIDYYSRSLEYIMRSWEKNGLEDLEKGQWYLNRLIESLTPLEVL